MQTSGDFTGLGMPVFTAFGWAGEEAALNYALAQLELFVATLHASLTENQRENLPFFGLNKETQNVYLAGAEDPEQDVYVTFNARPASLEMQLALTDKEALKRALGRIEKDPLALRRLLAALGPGWSLRMQQMRVDDESGDQGHYQDLYKDDVANLNDERAQELIEKAVYLNKDDSWVTPFYLSMRIPAEQAAAMKGAIIPIVADHMATLDPVITVLRGRTTRKTLAASSRAKTAVKKKPSALPEGPVEPPSDDGFSYATELRPLHIDRGFINMTPTHWPFFAINARTESRPVVVISDGKKDEESSVWRLQPGDMARLMLGPQAHRWLEDHFVAGDNIQLLATKLENGDIQVVLEAYT
jgi:hypothetical protein